jgi:hypothetical protein
MMPCCFVGCGGGGATSSDDELVMEAISNLSDAARERESFQELFIAGRVPNDAQRQRYSQCLVRMEPPVVLGHSATAEVQVTIDGRESVQQWTFARENGVWKIQDAPLPK